MYTYTYLYTYSVLGNGAKSLLRNANHQNEFLFLVVVNAINSSSSCDHSLLSPWYLKINKNLIMAPASTTDLILFAVTSAAAIFMKKKMDASCEDVTVASAAGLKNSGA